MMPPMMHQVDTDRMASPSSPSLRPQRQVKYTATATATNVRKPCHDSMNPPTLKMLGPNGMLITARMSMNLCSLLKAPSPLVGEGWGEGDVPDKFGADIIRPEPD